ncbi:hypothetical protein C8D87_114136 [Lentzea atacamensis]|uniref:Uncharacterized protein n=1 Tax=Lentzea atacamensis TaxID=531938 RepID=A0ABX9DYL8_9PSEU|nr:hypothetical protein [Lentzea atacamensis]RAS59524.1 hypothetical protein C8D87_114136 [Lentzea atacamensis]
MSNVKNSVTGSVVTGAVVQAETVTSDVFVTAPPTHSHAAEADTEGTGGVPATDLVLQIGGQTFTYRNGVLVTPEHGSDQR